MREKGFTFVELVVAVAILATIAGVLVPAVQNPCAGRRTSSAAISPSGRETRPPLPRCRSRALSAFRASPRPGEGRALARALIASFRRRPRHRLEPEAIRVW